MFNSIKLKLVALFLAVFALFFTGLEIFAHYKLEELVVSLADEHLITEVETLANLLTVEEGHHDQGFETNLAEIALAAKGVYADRLSGHYYQIVSPDGKIVVSSPSLFLAGESLPIVMAGPEPEITTITGPGNASLRMISRSYKFSAGPLVFQAADSIEETHKLLNSFRKVFMAIFPAVFLACGLGVYVIAGLALKSLESFASKISHITEENLGERIRDDGLAEELKPLASSFNTMLGRLERSFTRQKQFLSDASHELRTPTSIIKSCCEVTLGRERQGAEYREAVRKIGETVDRMCGIINRILAISRLDNKTVELRHSRVELMDVMRGVLKVLDITAANKGVELTLAGADIAVKGDSEGLMDVMTNLVENAIKYNKPGGRVDIELKEEGGWCVASIADTGIGIPHDEKEKIFDRFYRVDSSRGTTVGSGLGLSIAKAIVDAHGGRIELNSSPGKGSTFAVYLPKDAG